MKQRGGAAMGDKTVVDAMEPAAVKAAEVWAVDASSYFSRPGPRLVEGIELMASILHPEIFGVPDRDRARRVNLGRRNEPALHA